MFKSLRTALFWSHLVSGVVAGVVILIMCVTGVALTYQKEMQYWADTRHYRAEPPVGGRRINVERLLTSAQAVDPETPATTVAWRSDPAAPASVTLGARTIYLNPYSAVVYGEGTGQGLRQFFTSMTNWHRYVALAGDQRPLGKAITGAANLLFLFIVFSGMYLWWPRSLGWAQVRNVMWFRRGLRPKARDFNWHNTIGFWSALPLALVVYSATVISYPWSNNLVYRAMGEEPPAPAAGRAGGPGPSRGATLAPAEPVGDVDRFVERAIAQQRDWQSLSLRLPVSLATPIVFTIDRGDAGQPNLRGTLTLDAYGDTEKWEDFSALSPGRRVRTFLRFAHTGEIGGLSGQTVAGVVTAGGAVLVYTGLALAIRRLWAWLRR